MRILVRKYIWMLAARRICRVKSGQTSIRRNAVWRFCPLIPSKMDQTPSPLHNGPDPASEEPVKWPRKQALPQRLPTPTKLTGGWLATQCDSSQSPIEMGKIMGKTRKLPRETAKMQKVTVAQALLAILQSKNNWENRSQKWEWRKK